MFRLFKRLRVVDYVFIVAIIGLTFFQVYSTMELADCTKDIVGAIAKVSLGVSKTSEIWKHAGLLIMYAAFVTISQAVMAVMAAGVASNLATNVRRELNEKISSMSISEVNRFQTASLVTRTTNDIQQFQMAVLWTLRMFFAAPITAVWAILKIKESSDELTLATASVVTVMVIVIIVIGLLVVPKFKLTQALIDRVNGVARENLVGVRVVRAYNAESYQNDKFDKINNSLAKVQLFTGRVMALLMPVISLAMNASTLLILWIGATLINKGDIDYGSVQAFQMLASQIIMAFMMLLMMFLMIPRAIVCANRINEVLTSKDNFVDPEVEEETIEEGSIEFKDVSFTYPDGDNPAVEGLSFRIEKGQTLAFIGSTGSGKSTILNLMCRFFDATEGEILVDGVNVKNLRQETLRNKIGLVPQKGVLFSGSIRDNIAFGKPDMSMEDVENAAKTACADAFIAEMGGYDSSIAQGGTNVSGGQRQRLCIARAIAFKPEFVIFDDSFSALDFKTDKTVRENLAKSLSTSTKVIVAQRIGTIMNADKIVVIADGKMAGYGTHSELLKNCKTYRDIALSQLSEEELGL